jgi:hypothetical protein
VQALTAASKLERKLGQRLKGQLHEQQSPAAINRNGGANTGAASLLKRGLTGKEPICPGKKPMWIWLHRAIAS